MRHGQSGGGRDESCEVSVGLYIKIGRVRQRNGLTTEVPMYARRPRSAGLGYARSTVTDKMPDSQGRGKERD